MTTGNSAAIYLLIPVILVVIALVAICILGHHRRAQNPRNSSRVAPMSSRFTIRPQRPRGDAGVHRMEEGLDESGEAPPAYDASGKPPSISDGDSSSDYQRSIEAHHQSPNLTSNSGENENEDDGEDVEAATVGEAVAIPMRSFERGRVEGGVQAQATNQPPGYEEAAATNSTPETTTPPTSVEESVSSILSRPPPVLITSEASDRFKSMRQPASGTEASS